MTPLALTRSKFRSAHAAERSAAPWAAFTLVELLMVTSVVAVLMSIMLPSFKRAREDARRTVCMANIKHIGVSLFTYSTENRDLGPRVMSRIGATAPRLLLSTSSGLVNMGLMLPNVVPDPNVFYCPSQTRFDPAYTTDLTKLGRESVACSYAYALNVAQGKSPKLGSIRHLALVSDDFVAPSGDTGIGRYSHRVGYNVLYTDGSAAWYADPDESVWKRSVPWDDERDNLAYATLYKPQALDPDGPYGAVLDVFRVWYSFCYSQPDPF